MWYDFLFPFPLEEVTRIPYLLSHITRHYSHNIFVLVDKPPGAV